MRHDLSGIFFVLSLILVLTDVHGWQAYILISWHPNVSRPCAQVLSLPRGRWGIFIFCARNSLSLRICQVYLYHGKSDTPVKKVTHSVNKNKKPMSIGNSRLLSPSSFAPPLPPNLETCLGGQYVVFEWKNVLCNKKGIMFLQRQKLR